MNKFDSKETASERHALRQFGWAFLLILAAAGGIAVGARWRDPIMHRLGLAHEAPETQPAAADQLWTCGMHPQVIQDKPGTCPICHMKLTPLATTGAATTGPTRGERKIKYWWDPMIGPSSISDKPGKSAMGMDLVPVYEDEVAAGPTVTIDPVVVQNMGVRVATVTEGPLSKQIRAVGYLAEAQPNIRDVNLRVSGWIEKLYADTEGMYIQKGEPLFELYSPQVLAALQELTVARRSRDAVRRELPAAMRADNVLLYRAAEQKLLLFGLSREQVDKLAAADPTPTTVTFQSPITGHLTEKMVVDGAAVKAGGRALRIVDLSALWLDAQIYEQDLPFISLGRKVAATVESMPGQEFEGEVIFIHPQVDPMTRTATVRMALPNPALRLRPGMYATAIIQSTVDAQAVLVPREAIIDTGARQVAFVSLGEGRFEPRKLQTGVSGDDGMVQVLKGLSAGDSVVTSGQFLLDAESRMKEAIQKHLEAKLLKKGNGKEPATGMSHEMPTHASAPAATAARHEAGQTQPTKEVPLPWTPDVDKVYAGYLEFAKVLGAPQETDAPLDVTKLIEAATALANATVGPRQRLPKNVLEAAAAMKNKPLAEQRKLFKSLSNAVIAMAETCPPSAALGDRLYVAYCPMALDEGAYWLQSDATIANPYYATEMKQCGEIKRAINTVKDPNGR